jgi:hypothetical protein
MYTWLNIIILALLVSTCSEAQFTRKEAKSRPAKDKDHLVKEDKTDKKKKDPSLTPGEQDDKCVDEIVTSGEPNKLKEVFNWIATGDTAAFNQVMATPIVGPLSASDATPTIFATAFQACDYRMGGAYLYAIDGASGAQKWVSSVKIIASSSAAIGNIDGGEENEIVVFGLDKKAHALDATGKEKWVSTADAVAFTDVPYYHGGPILADLDEDGQVEVISAKGVFNGKDGNLKFALEASGVSPIVSDTDGTPGLEVVNYNGIYKADGTKLCALPVVVVHAAAGQLRETDKFKTIVARRPGVVPATIVGINGATCELLFETEVKGGGGGPLNISDLNGDGNLDFGTAGAEFYATFLPNGDPFWEKPTKDKSSMATGATTFDFNTDGKNEIVYNDEDFLRIFDGRTGKTLYETANSSGTLVEYPVIVDTNGDGHANIVVHANDCFSYTNKSAKGIRVFQDPDNKWVGTRSIWNQHAYDPLLVSETGEIAGIDQEKIYKPWLSKKHLVGFRNNIPRPNKECKKAP